MLKFEAIINRKAAAAGLESDLISVSQLQDLNVENLQRAVIFLHALWSGPSVVALQTLCNVMASTTTKFQIVVIDTDELSSATYNNLIDRATSLFGPVIGGWGEACWIRDGQVIAKDILGKPMTVNIEKRQPEPIDLTKLLETRIAQVLEEFPSTE